MNKYKLIPVVFLIIIAASAIFLLRTPSRVKPQTVSPAYKISPTPFPFMELTVEYLRQRSFDSSIGKLDKINEGNDYISYQTSYDSDGLKVNALLTEPKGENPAGGWPAVIFIHGYIPPKEYRTQVNYQSYVDYLAGNGLAVFKIDLRGHGTSQGDPGGAYYSSDYVIDTLNAYQALKNIPFINPDKIGLWGHSMAGNVVLRSLVVRPEIPAAVVWAGAVYSYADFARYGIADSSYQPPQSNVERVRRRRELFLVYGEPKNGHPFWKLVAPTSFLDDLEGAIQIHHAQDDNVVDIGYSRNLIKLLHDAKIPSELNEYQSGGHNLTGNTFSQAMQKTVDFYRKYLTD